MGDLYLANCSQWQLLIEGHSSAAAAASSSHAERRIARCSWVAVDVGGEQVGVGFSKVKMAFAFCSRERASLDPRPRLLFGSGTSSNCM